MEGTGIQGRHSQSIITQIRSRFVWQSRGVRSNMSICNFRFTHRAMGSKHASYKTKHEKCAFEMYKVSNNQKLA